MGVQLAATTMSREAGFLQGISLVLPVTLSVMGIAAFTATVAMMQDHFSYLAHGEYLVGLLQTMPAFWIVVFSPIAGWLADRYGRRPNLILAMLIHTVAGVMPYFLENMGLILTTRCFVGISESMILICTSTLLCDYFHNKERNRWLAAQTGAATLSSLLIIWIGGVLGAKFGWHGPFLLYLSSLPLVAAVLAFTWEPARDSAQVGEESDANVRYHTLPWARLLGIAAISVLGSISFYTTITQNAIALKILGVTAPKLVGQFSAFASIGVAIGSIVFSAVGRLGIGGLLSIEFLLIGVGFTGMGNSATPMYYALAANIQQIGCGMMLPTLLVWATRGLSHEIRARGIGLWQGSFSIGLFVSAGLLTYLARQFGGLFSAFEAFGKISVAAALFTVVAHFGFARRRVFNRSQPGSVFALLHEKSKGKETQ
ncbi:MAG: MFS transporter [Pseudomonadota bacterium]|nr:MFS transporter [Pseudomonadota bacterium]